MKNLPIFRQTSSAAPQSPRPRRIMPHVVVLCLCLPVLSASIANAQTTNTWTGATNQDWNTAGNWSLGSVPGVATNANLTMSGSSVTVNYDTEMATNFGRLTVANSAASFATTLNINAPGFVSVGSNSMAAIGAFGRIVVGTNGVLEIRSTSAAGYGQGGRLTVNGSATISNYSSFAATGGDSRITLNSGTLTLSANTVDGDARLARLYDGLQMNINGGVADLRGGMTLGYSVSAGRGTVTMTNGTLLLGSANTTVASRIGHGGGPGTFTMSGGTVTNFAGLTLGVDSFATNSLTISGGTWVQNGGVNIGLNTGGNSSSITLTNTGAFTTTNNTTIGNSGAFGRLNLNGGTYTATNASGNANLVVRRGELNISGGTLTVDRLTNNPTLHTTEASRSANVVFNYGVLRVGSSFITNSNNLAFTVGNGGAQSAVLQLGGGAHTFANGLVVAANGTLSGTGTIAGNTTISGIHSPGNSAGIQTFSNNLTYNGTSPEVLWELTANTTTQGSPTPVFDQIIVGGNLDFSVPTTLNLSFNFTGSTVDWSNSLWSNNITGTAGWLIYDVAGTLTNFNNISVAAADWADGQGDLFNTVRAGSTFSLYQEGNDIYLNYAVPEPSTYALLVLAAAGLGVHVIRRRRS